MWRVKHPKRPGIRARDREDGTEMTAIRASYRSLSQLADLNWDRLLYAATISVALVAGAFFGQFFL